MKKRLIQFSLISVSFVCGIVFAHANILEKHHFVYSSHHSMRAFALPQAIPANDETVGTIKGRLSVSATGAANYSIPISVPAGTADMAPKLSITYDSQKKNGILGMGFSINGLSSITRSTWKLAQNGLIHGVDFTDADRFSLNGQELIAMKGLYGKDQTEYRTYLASQSKIVSYGTSGTGPASFKVWTKGGQIAEYGATDDSSLKADVKNPDGTMVDGQTVKVWGLDKIQDTAGNYLSIHYTKTDDTGEMYPSEIDYTANDAAGLKPYSKINFIYEDRTDVRDLYHAGSLTKTQKRLKEIQVSTLVNGQYQWIYVYKINYEYSPNSFRSRVTSIQECNNNGVCFQPTTFQWQTNEEGWEEAPQYLLPSKGQDGQGEIVDGDGLDKGVRFLDLTGDGLPDFIQSGVWYHTHDYLSYKNNGNGWSENNNYLMPYENHEGDGYIVDESGRDKGIRFIDLTGNGLPDFVQNGWWGSAHNDMAYINNGVKWVKDLNYLMPAEGHEGDGLISDDKGRDKGVRFIDLNGNGLIDFVQNGWWGSTHNSMAYINTSNGWKADKNYLMPAEGHEGDGLISDDKGRDKGVRFIDLNGNGLIDFVQNGWWGSTHNSMAYINTGSGWKADKNYLMPSEGHEGDGVFEDNEGQDKGIRFLDLNGDGLPDFIQSGMWGSTHNNLSYINTGKGWKKNPIFLLPSKQNTALGIINYAEGQDGGVRFIDLNGDGLPDFVQSAVVPVPGTVSQFQTVSYAYINRSSGWKEDKNYLLPSKGNFGDGIIVNMSSHDNGVRLIDLNGNGITDFIQSGYTKGLPLVGDVKNDLAFYNKAKKLPDYLIGVTDGLGEKTSIDYEPLSGVYVKVYAQEKNSDGTLISKYPNPQFYGPMYVVYQTASDTATNDPQTKAKYQSGNGQVKTFPQSPYSTLASNNDGSQHITTYHYAGARVNKLGYGFLGFHKVQTTDNTTGITTTVTYSQDPSQHNISQPLSTVTKQSNGKVLSSIDNTWDLKTFGDGTVNHIYYLPYVKQRIKKTYSLNGDLLSTIHTDTTMDNYANPTEVKVTTYDGTGTYIADTKNTYKNDTDKWLMGEVTDTTVTRSAPDTPDISRTSHFDYDANTGMLMTTIVEPNDPDLMVDTEYQRDQFGNVISTTISGNNFATRTSSVKYDDQGRFVISQTNALGQTTTQVVDPRFGKPLSVTDANHLTTTYQYDGWGRLILSTNPDKTTISSSYAWEKASVGTGMNETPMYAVYGVFTQATDSPTNATYYDQLSRPVAKSTQGINGTLIWSNTFYDDLGRVIQQCQKHFDNDQTYSSRFIYDVLGRMTETDNPDGTKITVQYNGFTTTTINQLGQKSTKVTNAIGKIRLSTDNAGNMTTYHYDAYGNMTSMKDSKNNVASIQYDKMGRKININDPDKGTWSYQYDALGNLTSQTDAMNHTTTMQYDLLNRLIARTDSGNTSTWTYGTDASKHNVGKLIHVTGVADANGNQASSLQKIKAAQDGIVDYERTIDYNDLALPQDTTVKINGNDYTTSVIYDKDSRPDVTTFSNGTKIKNVYNSLGYLTDKQDTTSNVTYWHLNAMDAEGHVTSFTRSNGLITINTYNPKNGFLTDIETKPGTALKLQQQMFPALTHYKTEHHRVKHPLYAKNDSQIQSLHYDYDALGNVQKKRNQSTNEISTPKYDNLNRITIWMQQPDSSQQKNNFEARAYQYDELGNITYKSDVGHYHYGENAGPHAVTSITDDAGNIIGTFKYDADGNQIQSTLNGKSRTISYTSYQKPLDIKTDDAEENFYYNADRNRFMRMDQQGAKTDTTLYLGDEQIITHQNGTDVDTETKISVGGALIDIDQKNGTKTYELLTDNIGSTSVITDQIGNVVERFSYTPFGEQTQVEGAKPDHPITHKGFTGHETIESMNLIHMNGRIYDPVLGRFLSADPEIQDPTNSQSLNRYTYCMNNPLALTDPTGYSWISHLWHDITHTIESILTNQYVDILISVAISCIPGMQWYATAVCESIFAMGTTAMEGGNIEDVFKAGVTAFIASSMPAFDKGIGIETGGIGSSHWYERILVHGLSGGGMQTIEGGSFADGFLAGAVMEASQDPISKINQFDFRMAAMGERSLASGVVGGVVSDATGGNFANGFKTTAFRELCSEDGHLFEYGKAVNPKPGEAYVLARKLDFTVLGFHLPLLYPFVHTGVYVDGHVYGLRPDNGKMTGSARFDEDHPNAPSGKMDEVSLQHYVMIRVPGLGDHFDGNVMLHAVHDVQHEWDARPQFNSNAIDYNLFMNNCHDASTVVLQDYARREGL